MDTDALLSFQDAIKALVPGSTIELEGGAKWLGDPFASSAIYVREVYPELIAARDALVRERGWPQSGFETVFTGTPGTCRGNVSNDLSRCVIAMRRAFWKVLQLQVLESHTLGRCSWHKSC